MSADLMRFDWWTLALQAVNFAILVWLLQRFLYKPVLRLVDARRAAIEQQFQGARDAEAKAAALQARAEADRATIAAERITLLKAAEVEAEAAAKTRRARAEREATELLDSGRKLLSREREEALGVARNAAVDLGIGIARRLLGQLPPRVQAAAWLDQIERQLAAMPRSEIERLMRRGTGESTVTVVTAAALPDAVAAEWRQRLSPILGDNTALSFEYDPALIAGVDVKLPNAVLRLSWQSALQSVRAEVMAHAGPC
jgi:F-type H+-transporting ATPase subunit b